MGIPETSDLELVSPNRHVRRNSLLKWFGGAVAIGVILQFYYFREMLAALFLFAILFVFFALIVGVVYLVGRAGEVGITAAEPAARRGMVMAEELSKKTFHRPRSAPVP